VNPEAATGITQVNVAVDRTRAARFGIDPADIAEAVELAYQGRTVGSVLQGQRKEYAVFMRLRPEDRAGVEDLGRLPIPLADGERVELNQVANMWLARGPAEIQRDNGERRVQVTANLDGTDLGSAVERLRSDLDSLDLPNGYRVVFGGSYESQREVQRAMAGAVIGSAIVILIILHAAFGSVAQAALVFLTVPLALCGGLLALFITGMTFNVSSMIGLLALFGLAVQTAVLLLQYANDARRRGLAAVEAAREAAQIRLRPVLMTTASASLAVLPLAVGFGAGAELQQPMAVVLIGGLLTGALITLLVLPSLFRFVRQSEK